MSLLMMPYTNLHELNLDWIIQNLKDAGVTSVNGETGIVVLYKEADVQLPDIPSDVNWRIVRKANGTMEGIKFNKALPMQRVHGTSEFNVYDAGNPPPYPVTSVNGNTGAVTVPVAFDSMVNDFLNISTTSPDHSWTLNRKTRDGDIALTLDSTNNDPVLKLDFVNNTETVDVSYPIMKKADIGYTNATVPLNTAAGLYKIGTLQSLGIPATAVIISAQCINCTESVCLVSSFGVNGDDVYVYLTAAVTQYNGVVRITYMMP